MLETIEADADRVTRLITELLDMSRIDAGRLQVRPQPVDVPRRRSTGTSSASWPAATSASGSSSTCPATSCPRVWADPDRLDQILANLIENAFRHGEGTVTPRGACRDPTRGADARRVVRDRRRRGRGHLARALPAGLQPVLARVPPGGHRPGPLRRQGPGRGARRAVEVDRAPGGGAQFRFTLPAGVPAHNA